MRALLVLRPEPGAVATGPPDVFGPLGGRGVPLVDGLHAPVELEHRLLRIHRLQWGLISIKRTPMTLSGEAIRLMNYIDDVAVTLR